MVKKWLLDPFSIDFMLEIIYREVSWEETPIGESPFSLYLYRLKGSGRVRMTRYYPMSFFRVKFKPNHGYVRQESIAVSLATDKEVICIGFSLYWGESVLLLEICGIYRFDFIYCVADGVLRYGKSRSYLRHDRCGKECLDERFSCCVHGGFPVSLFEFRFESQIFLVFLNLLLGGNGFLLCRPDAADFIEGLS